MGLSDTRATKQRVWGSAKEATEQEMGQAEITWPAQWHVWIHVGGWDPSLQGGW
jgi:hypothetical protein